MHTNAAEAPAVFDHRKQSTHCPGSPDNFPHRIAASRYPLSQRILEICKDGTGEASDRLTITETIGSLNRRHRTGLRASRPGLRTVAVKARARPLKRHTRRHSAVLAFSQHHLCFQAAFETTCARYSTMEVCGGSVCSHHIHVCQSRRFCSSLQPEMNSRVTINVHLKRDCMLWTFLNADTTASAILIINPNVGIAGDDPFRAINPTQSTHTTSGVSTTGRSLRSPILWVLKAGGNPAERGLDLYQGWSYNLLYCF